MCVQLCACVCTMCVSVSLSLSLFLSLSFSLFLSFSLSLCNCVLAYVWCVRVCACMYMHTYIHTYTYMHTYARARMLITEREKEREKERKRERKRERERQGDPQPPPMERTVEHHLISYRVSIYIYIIRVIKYFVRYVPSTTKAARPPVGSTMENRNATAAAFINSRSIESSVWAAYMYINKYKYIYFYKKKQQWLLVFFSVHYVHTFLFSSLSPFLKVHFFFNALKRTAQRVGNFVSKNHGQLIFGPGQHEQRYLSLRRVIGECERQHKWGSLLPNREGTGGVPRMPLRNPWRPTSVLEMRKTKWMSHRWVIGRTVTNILRGCTAWTNALTSDASKRPSTMHGVIRIANVSVHCILQVQCRQKGMGVSSVSSSNVYVYIYIRRSIQISQVWDKSFLARFNSGNFIRSWCSFSMMEVCLLKSAKALLCADFALLCASINWIFWLVGDSVRALSARPNSRSVFMMTLCK